MTVLARVNSWVKGWRTIAVNLLFAIVPVLELSEVRAVLPDGWLPWYALAMALANMGLRKLTTTPMGESQ